MKIIKVETLDDLVTITAQRDPGQPMTIEANGDILVIEGRPVEVPPPSGENNPVEYLEAWGGEINEYPDIASVDLPGVLRHQYDGTSVLDLRGHHAAMTITGRKKDGTPVSIAVERCQSKHGWPRARYYMLAMDADENIIPARGDNSRDIYVSTDAGALTSAAIGEAQKPALTAAQVTGAWLVARPEIGGSAAQKVSIEVANKIKAERQKIRTAFNREGTSDRYYLEAGKPDYAGLNFTITGESPIHPIVVTRFGEGHNPAGCTFGGNGAGLPGNIVFIGVDVRMRGARGLENLIVADCNGEPYFGSDVTSKGAGFGIYRMTGLDAQRDFPIKIGGTPVDTWFDENANRMSGAYWAHVLGSYAHSSFYDHNGWGEGYSPLQLWEKGKYPQSPSVFSHNIYTQKFNADMSFIDLLSMRAASVAGQMRIGGWQFGCVSLDNPIAYQNAGVRPSDMEPKLATENGFFPFNLRSTTHIGNNRPYGNQQGGKITGFDWQGVRTTDIDCIALHAADPDDPADIAAKPKHGKPASYARGARYSNFVAIGWDGNINVDGLSEAVYMQITVQRWIGKKLGKSRGTIQEFATYMRKLTPRNRQLAIREFNRYLVSARAGNLDLPLKIRTVPQTLIYKPSWKGEGRRCDNPINWSSLDTPIDGDGLNIYGNNRADWVFLTRALGSLSVGAGGRFDVSSGKVTFTEAKPGASVRVWNCGQLEFGTFNGNAIVRGGQFAVNGPSEGSIDASGNGEVSLGANWTVRDGQTFRISNDLGKVGWDSISPSGKLVIKAGGTLEFHATPIIEYGPWDFTAWEYWLNDFIGQTSGATGKFDGLKRMGERAYARIRDMTGNPVVGELTTKGEYLRPASGKIAAIHPSTLGKIEAGWAGRSGTATGATHSIVLEAGATVKLTGGTPASGSKDITGPGITVTNQGANLGAGFSVTGGKLVLTI